jgi:predicted ribosomally synthesized peptide with nif11-like leader
MFEKPFLHFGDNQINVKSKRIIAHIINLNKAKEEGIMTVNAAQQFMNQVKKDAALQKKLMSAGDNVQAIMKVAAEAGYKFSSDEFVAASVREWAQAAEALEETELDNVAGGGGNTKSAAGACYTLGSGPDCTGSGNATP